MNREVVVCMLSSLFSAREKKKRVTAVRSVAGLIQRLFSNGGPNGQGTA